MMLPHGRFVQAATIVIKDSETTEMDEKMEMPCGFQSTSLFERSFILIIACVVDNGPLIKSYFP